MEVDLIVRIANGKTTKQDAVDILCGICDDNHSSCNNNCPVYQEFGDIPWNHKGGNCKCYREGKRMLKYLETGRF